MDLSATKTLNLKINCSFKYAHPKTKTLPAKVFQPVFRGARLQHSHYCYRPIFNEYLYFGARPSGKGSVV